MTITKSKIIFKNIALLLLVLYSQCIDAQITLTHNIGTTPIKTDIASCEDEEYWARTFTLSDFGISTSDQFIIKSGQIAISNSYSGARLLFNFYSIDSNFPSSTPKRISYGNLALAPFIGDAPEIVQVDFSTPIVIQAGVERILVEVIQMEDIYNPDYSDVIIAGTEQDDDISWFKGCRELYTYTSTENLSEPVPNANFFINVTGEKFNISNSGSKATLTHNLCGEVIKTSMFSCSYSKLYWARLFSLDDFGVSTNEELTINFGQIGISSSDGGSGIQFNIYEVDDNFPSSFSETNLIGSSQVHRLPHIADYIPQIVTVNFETPVIVPSSVKKILVEVTNVITWGSGVFFVAGTEQDKGDSWYRGCGSGSPGYSMENYVTMVDPAFRKSGGYPDANFYINVTGDVNHVSNNFNMNISNICSEFLKEFSVEDDANVASIIWDFGDPASGINNVSTDLSPFHDFSADGTYTITATVKGKDASDEILIETIDVKEPPNAYGINDIYACEDEYNSGISSLFDLSMVEKQVLGSQTNKVVVYIDGAGNEYDTMPNPFTNTVRNREAITVRVSHNSNPCCYSETSFDLIVNPIPNLEGIEDLIVCDGKTNGFELFNLQPIKENIISASTNITVEFYHENGQLINEPLNAVENLVANEEVISIHTSNNNTNCYNEATFKLKISPLPLANTLNELVGCDDNNDGISEYFDTSNVKLEVLGNQTDMEVSYFDTNGSPLPSPLPNPYTNITANQEIVTVRVTNPLTNCYAETPLVLKTASQPQINKPQSLFGCDLGNGFANFDTSGIETELIGNQNGLKIIYFDTSGNQLPSPLPAAFQNTQAWSQTINVKVENELNNLCYSETSFDLIVNELQTVNIDKTYFICNLEPSLNISIHNDLNTYAWEYQNGDVISNTHEATLVNAGNYTLTVGKNKNGIYCENSFEFELIRSVLPTITEIKYKELSDNNFIKILASGDGEFEYSIDGINYQYSNLFDNIPGGTYTAFVRDTYGCGEDSKEITLVDYPKFFTPNSDGYNDYWHIFGIENYPQSRILIYDRYGKLITQLDANSVGWDGSNNGSILPSSDYWFKADLGSEKMFTGHFTLKR